MAANRSKFDCQHCIWGRHCDASNPAAFDKWAIPGVIESRTCLLPMITPFSWFMIELYGHYQNRLLPFSGGVLEQPAIYVEAMRTLDSTFNRISHEWPKPKS